MKKTLTARLTRAGIISALYIVLSLITLPISSGVVQFRPSEGLALLPLFFIEAVPGLFIGCLISNFLTGCILPDIILGSLVTLFSAILTHLIGRWIKNRWIKYALGGLFPVVLNALLLPLIWLAFTESVEIYYFNALYLLLSQSLSVYAIGIPLSVVIDKKFVSKPLAR